MRTPRLAPATINVLHHILKGSIYIMPVETIKDNDGKIVSFCEWTLCDNNGINSDVGEYCYIKELWIHHSVSFKNIIRYYINIIYNKIPTAKYAYWVRHKYNDRMKMFNLEQLKLKEK